MRSGLSASPVVTNAAVALPRIKIGIARVSAWRVCYLRCIVCSERVIARRLY